MLADEVVVRVGAWGTSSSLLSRNSGWLIRCKFYGLILFVGAVMESV